LTKCDLLPRDELAKRLYLLKKEMEEGEKMINNIHTSTQRQKGGGGGESNTHTHTHTHTHKQTIFFSRDVYGKLPVVMVSAGRGRKGVGELQKELAAVLLPV
jgi:hypothetical protein